MGLWEWILDHWANFSDLGVVIGLAFTVISLRSETKSRRITNLISLTENHRELWTDFGNHPTLARVLDPSANLNKRPLTRDEETFVNLTIQHVHAAYQAMHDSLLIKPEGLRKDIQQFFALPVPAAVWEKIKELQNDGFVAFVESCRTSK